MMNHNSEHFLPPGWTVKVKVRKNGKKDKYYFDPSSQMRFNSLPEVSRYLKTAEIDHSESEEGRALKQPANDVELKKAVAEGLPPGWIKEVRVTRTSGRTRRDSYYIDPINGNVLRSLKDVHRYLTTGKVKRFAHNKKTRRTSDVEFERDDTSVSALKSPFVSKKEMLAAGKARKQIIWGQNSSEFSEITKDEAISKNGSSVGESMSLSEPNSGPEGIITELHCSNLPKAKDSKQSEGKNDSSVIEFKSAPDKPLPCNYTKENGSTKNDSKKRQRKDEDINVPRRVSKRLAGLQAEPMLQIKTGRQAHPVACKDPASTTELACQSPENLKSIDIPSDSCTKEFFCVDSSFPPKHAKQVKSHDSVLHLGKQDVPKKYVGKVGSEDKNNVKQGTFLKMPMEELLTDPCIAFAIKTLGGGALDTSISSKAPPMPNDIEYPSGNFSVSNEKRNSGPENKLDEKQGCSAISPSTSLPVSGNVVEKLGSTVELPVGELMADPCIEFAIKTLTGEIPLDNNSNIEDYFQHQLSSSKTQ